jgi:hypothetical protein
LPVLADEMNEILELKTGVKILSGGYDERFDAGTRVGFAHWNRHFSSMFGRDDLPVVEGRQEKQERLDSLKKSCFKSSSY